MKVKIKIKKGDMVRVITGKHKGLESPVLKVNPKQYTVELEGITNTKHVKPTQDNQEGGIQKVPACIRISNVSLIDPKKKTLLTKVGYTVKDGKKIRIARRSNTKLS